MSISIRVDTSTVMQYLDQVIGNLELVGEVSRDNLIRGMNLALGLAQIYTPVDTGRLRDNLHLTEEGDGIALVADPINEYGQSYARYVEDKTGFMAQALEEGIDEIVNGVELSITNMFVKDYFVRQGRQVEVLRSTETGRFVRRGE